MESIGTPRLTASLMSEKPPPAITARAVRRSGFQKNPRLKKDEEEEIINPPLSHCTVNAELVRELSKDSQQISFSDRTLVHHDVISCFTLSGQNLRSEDQEGPMS